MYCPGPQTVLPWTLYRVLDAQSIILSEPYFEAFWNKTDKKPHSRSNIGGGGGGVPVASSPGTTTVHNMALNPP